MAQQSTQQVEIVTNDIFSFADLSHDLERKKKYHSIDDYISLSKCNQGIKLFSYAFKLCLSSYQADNRQTGMLEGIKDKIREYCQTGNISDSIRDSGDIQEVQVGGKWDHGTVCND
ncbi:MAG: hypothetical protein ACI9CD_000471 [Candidatus Deianiraeaceae bacterium]|jgi:hypothetical protein